MRMRVPAWLVLVLVARGADVMDLARDAAPELFADAAVRLVEGGKVPSIDVQRDLLTEAFEAAARAQEPVRRRAVPGLGPDTRAFLQGQAGGLGLDTLSLRARVLRALVTIDRSKARELFERMPNPALSAGACEDALVPDAGAYYETAALAAQSAFSDKERADGRHVQLLSSALAGAATTSELAAFARALTAVALKPAETKLLRAEFAARLESAAADYRAFTIGIGELRGEVERLGTEGLARAFAQYLKNQMSARRCEEDLGDNGPVIEWFNAKFRGAAPAIEAKDVTPPEQRGPGMVAPGYFDSEDGARMHMALLALQLAAEGPRDQAERATAEWRYRFADFLQQWQNWQASGSEIDVFHKKMLSLRLALDLAVVPEDRETASKLGVVYLASVRAQKESPAEWTYQAKVFMDAAGSREAYKNSGSAGLALLASY
jgi:hypothetical protein